MPFRAPEMKIDLVGDGGRKEDLLKTASMGGVCEGHP